MRNLSYIGIALLLLALAVSCKKQNADPVEMGYRYFPVNTGHWVIYDVDSISYNDFTGTVDSFNFQIKELVQSDFVDNQGRPSQRLERYVRYADTAAWVIRDVWYETRTVSCAERVEENVRQVKLIFPVRESLQWNANTYNTLGEQLVQYEAVHTTGTVNNILLDSTLTVLQKSVYTLISEDFQKEMYAAGIGLVYKKYVSLVKDPVGTITSGIDYSYTLHAYGN